MPHRPLSALLTGFAVISFTTAAGAQAPAQAKPIPRADIVLDLTANYKGVDTNGDGSVTVAEISAAQTRGQQALVALHAKRLEETFTKLDTNKDGQLSQAEFKAGSPVPQRPRTDPAKILAELDSNKDQKVSLAEFSASTLANFDRADTNHDGVVSPEEAQKARSAQR